MARTSSSDPLDRFRWKLTIAAPAGKRFARAGFTSCSTPGVTIEFTSYPEGGSHMVPRLIAGGASFKPITLSRGVVAQKGVDDFAAWMEQVFQSLNPEPGREAASENYRRDILLEHLDRDGDVIKTYRLLNCVPISYSPASDFDALDETGLSVESLSFQYEGFEEETQGDMTSVVDKLKGLF